MIKTLNLASSVNSVLKLFFVLLKNCYIANVLIKNKFLIMKKLFTIAAVAVLGMTSVNAQDFNLGINGGMPLGDAGDISSFSAVLDLNYLWEVSDEFEAGLTAGFSHSFGKEDEYSFGGTTITVEAEDISFVPVGAAARFNVSDSFTIGADLGYAIGINDGNDGGFYYAPKLQYGISESLDLVAAYRGVSADGGSFDIATLGVEF